MKRCHYDADRESSDEEVEPANSVYRASQQKFFESTSKERQFERVLIRDHSPEWMKGMDYKLKCAICYYYCHVKKFEEITPGLVHEIMSIFKLQNDKNCNHYNLVHRTLANVLECERQGLDYDPYMKYTHIGKTVIQDYTAEANIVYDAYEKGLSSAQVTALLNAYRANVKPPLCRISKSAVDAFSKRSEVILRQHRQTKKSGKDDENSSWAIGRLKQSIQFRYQIEMTKLGVIKI